MRILIVEDDTDLANVIVHHLNSEGNPTECCTDATTAMNFMTQRVYDAVIMDIMLPGMNGLDIVRWMRQQHMTTPVCFLTALDSVEDRVNGLDAGGDYYLTKPFALEELSACLRALTRRTTETKQNIYQVGDLTLDIKKHTVTRAGQSIILSKREFSILEYMMRNAGIVLTREQIEGYIWNYDYSGDSNIVDVYISNLRRKIDAGFEQKLICTIHAVGYTIREAH